MWRKLILAVAPLFILWNAQPAHPQIFAYSVSSKGDDQLYRLDLLSGSEQLIGPVGFADVEALAFHPVTRTLYGVDDATDTLITIDTATGAGAAVGAGPGNLGVILQDVGLTFDSLGNLWMSSDSTAMLYAVDPVTGTATQVGALGQAVTGLSAVGTALFGLGGDGTDNLVTIDPTTGAATPVGALVNLLSLADGGITFEPDGTLWVISDPEGEIGTVDPATGEASYVSKVPSGRYESLAIAPPSAGICEAIPKAGCKRPVAASKSSFSMSAKENSASWRWKWGAGASTTIDDLGHPETGTAYSLCVYDHLARTPVLVMSAFAPPGADWNGKGGKMKYKKKKPAPDGMSKISLKPGPAGKASIQASAKGKGMLMPAMPLSEDGKVTVQLLSLHGACWEAEYAGPAKTNSASRYSGSGQ